MGVDRNSGYDRAPLGLDVVSNPEDLQKSLRCMTRGIDSLRVTVNELVVDHSTQCEYNSGILSGMSEIIADNSKFLSSHDCLVSMISKTHTQDDVKMSCYDSLSTDLGHIYSYMSHTLEAIDTTQSLATVSGTLSFADISDVQKASAGIARSQHAAPAVMSMSNVVAGPAQLTASSVIQDTIVATHPTTGSVSGGTPQ